MSKEINNKYGNALHTYHEFKYNEELGVYVYTFIRPYDD